MIDAGQKTIVIFLSQSAGDHMHRWVLVVALKDGLTPGANSQALAVAAGAFSFLPSVRRELVAVARALSRRLFLFSCVSQGYARVT